MDKVKECCLFGHIFYSMLELSRSIPFQSNLFILCLGSLLVKDLDFRSTSKKRMVFGKQMLPFTLLTYQKIKMSSKCVMGL